MPQDWESENHPTNSSGPRVQRVIAMSRRKITMSAGSAPEGSTEEIDSVGPVPSEEKTAHRDCESVELGIGSRSHLADAVRPVPGVQPHGLLVVPPEVEAGIARQEDELFEDTGLRLTAAARFKLIIDQTLDWYFRDQWVSYRETPRGVDMLAVGPDEIGRLMQSSLSQEDLLSIRTRQI
jgi:hypothetical protein